MAKTKEKPIVDNEVGKLKVKGSSGRNESKLR
jgi:hypothetical protein